MVTTVSAEPETLRDLRSVLEAAEGRVAADSVVLGLLQNLAVTLGRGGRVTLLEQDEHVSPNVAARMLGMSRPHLLSFMDAGALAFTRVGTHRRIRVCDLLEFDERRLAARKLVATARTNATSIEDRHLDKTVPVSAAALADLDSL
ncbi:helix-turn-helix domain-containing protein [Cellulomonas fengjieae]|uniref:Helix-turn-helix domain-containing protein n=1 Tax=Cellulomonas fengjieae TaxID=2819978 RepID=A0ABS3SFL0_9CELL|nr:helix-turn-helix domain-containing protein [Cellulomonas fengjieae]MBO3084109.1 helix-turn-helix domain-containing protein [Cellulomonas fengjieae]QVI64636.1 helix-turn-helix domain-containing protein [Cellulomonas fengjieae]